MKKEDGSTPTSGQVAVVFRIQSRCLEVDFSDKILHRLCSQTTLAVVNTMLRYLLPSLVTYLLTWPSGFAFGQGFNTRSGNSTIVVVVRAASKGELPGFPRVELILEGRRVDYGDCDTKGEYTFYFVPEGMYVVRARLPGYAPAAQDVPAQSDTRQRIVLELQPLGEGVADDRTDVRQRAGAKQEILAARQSRAKGDWSGAIQHMERAEEDAPHRVDIQMELGFYYWKAERLDEARASFEKSIELDSSLLAAHLNLAQILSAKSEIDEAREILHQASEAHPKRSEPLFLLAQLEVGSGNLGEAEKAANRALERDHSRVPQVYLLLAGIHQAKGDLNKETAALETYHCQTASMALSHALHQARHLEESSEVLKQLLHIRPDSVQDRDAWWRYLCRRSGRSDSMLSELREEVLQ